MTKGLVYYTNNSPADNIFLGCQKQLNRCMAEWHFPIISVSQKPIDFGQNIVVNFESSVLSMFKQIVIGLEACNTEAVFLIEHDVLYHPSHFDFTPERKDRFYYNRNMWHVSAEDGKAVFYLHNDPSHLCADRELLLRHYRKVVAYVEQNGWSGSLGFSPPKGLPKEERIGRYNVYKSAQPNIDIRHGAAFTRQRMDRSQFRSANSCREWTEAEEVPFWGRTKDRFDEFMEELWKS